MALNARHEPDPFAAWCAIELMGHRRLFGYVTEQQLAGVPMLRVDVPAAEGQGAVTQFYRPNAVYCLTPTAESVARAMAARYRPEPVHPFELPAPSPRPEPVEASAPGEATAAVPAYVRRRGQRCFECGAYVDETSGSLCPACIEEGAADTRDDLPF